MRPKSIKEFDDFESAPLFQADWATDLIIISLFWAAMVILAKPIGNFPLNDDWSYGMAVKRLVEGHGYHPTGWTEMTLITQVLWGSLFCLPNGFSFTTLRFSTLTLSLLGMIGMYLLIRQLQRPRMLAVCCALTLGCNPIYFALSNTFMTDVPFTTLAILAALFFVRHLQRGLDADLVLGTAFAVATTLCRQLGICLALAFGIVLLLKQGFQRRAIIRSAAPSIVSVGVMVAFQHWLKATGKLPALYSHRAERLLAVLTHPASIPMTVSYHGWNMLMYLGWFLLPVTLLSLWNQRTGERGSRSALLPGLALVLFLVASAVRLVLVPSLMPVHNNVIIPQGIGPATLQDTQNLHLAHLPALPTYFWVFVTALSLVGAALLVVKTTGVVFELFPSGRFARTDSDGAIGLFFLLCAFGYLIPFFLSGFFDRYLVPVVAFLLGFVAVSLDGPKFQFARSPYVRLRFIPTFLLIGSMTVFAVAGTRDYLQWNRTRWKASNDLLAQKDVKPRDIDGGFEFNGWYLYDTFGKTNWWVVDGAYVIAFGDIPGYEPIRSYSYAQWMPPHDGTIFVLKRKTEH